MSAAAAASAAKVPVSPTRLAGRVNSDNFYTQNYDSVSHSLFSLCIYSLILVLQQKFGIYLSTDDVNLVTC
jgi:hypothetical protein